MQYKIEMMLNPDEDDHNEIVKLVGTIRDVIHDERLSEIGINKKLDKLIPELVNTSKRVLKRDCRFVKKGR